MSKKQVPPTYEDLVTGSHWINKRSKREAILHYGLDNREASLGPYVCGTKMVGYRYTKPIDGHNRNRRNAPHVQSCNVQADNFLRKFSLKSKPEFPSLPAAAEVAHAPGHE
jgi:hypothetical protein